jgi:dihydroneopterin aldolase
MDRVFIEGLSLAGKHGVGEHERRIEQEFVFDISATFDASKPAKSDNLKDTIDYMWFRDIAREVINHSPHFLIEKIAGDIATKILNDKRIAEVTITIRKPAVLPGGVPGISITRSR